MTAESCLVFSKIIRVNSFYRIIAELRHPNTAIDHVLSELEAIDENHPVLY